MKKSLILLLLVLTVSACGSLPSLTRQSLYPGMYEERPLTLLVMPPINNTANVEAKDLLYTSISRPLIEAGYYVIPPALAMDVLRQESAYDAELFLERPLRQFHDFFGADAVVFSVIEDWAKQGIGIRTKIRYFIRSTTTDRILFDRTCDLFLDLTPDTRGALGALVGLATAALSTAFTDPIEAARQANYNIFQDLPCGKYNKNYLKDQDFPAEPSNVTKHVK